MDFWAAAVGNVLDGTGVALTITAIANAPQAGASRDFYPIVGTILTQGATFDIDGAVSRTAAAGEVWTFVAKSVNTYRVFVRKADGTAVVSTALTAGQVIRSTQTIKTDTFSTTSTTLVAITGISVTTPVDSSRTTADQVNVKVRLQAGSGGDEALYALFRGAVQIFMGDAAGTRTRVSAGLGSTGTGIVNTVAFDYIDSPATTGQTTYTVQVLVRSGTTYINRSATDTDGATWGRMASSITTEEIKG